MADVRTAVFPVAGFGTRFLPATKAMPKVLLPVVDRPLIQFAVDEAINAGIESLIFVTGRGHAAIQDYFDVSYELERELVDRGKLDLAAKLEALRPSPGQFAFIRQMEPLGLGHAVWCARNLVGNEPFAVLLADELIVGEDPPLETMIDVHHRRSGNVVLVDEVDQAKTDRYGIVEPSSIVTDGVIDVRDVVEKPAPHDAPSNLAIIGRYVLEPSVMEALSDTAPGAGGEIQLTDAIRHSLGTTPLRAVTNRGTRFDCGSPSGFLRATAHVAMEDQELRPTMESIAADITEGKRS